MKEIYKIPKGQNVATSEGWKHIDTEIKNFVYETEQVPETFEELKELCRGIKGVEYSGGNAKGEIIEISNVWFAENGEIWGYTDDFTGICNISKDRTPQQMWQIIKSLIGEE